MRIQLNQAQFILAIQEKNKMPFDHDALSASTQRPLPSQSIPHDRSRPPSQSSVVCQPSLHPCSYISLQCSRCGSVRQAIANLPTQAFIACPECNRECSFLLLGSGLTTRSLPFHQIHSVEPTRWDQSIDGETNSS